MKHSFLILLTSLQIISFSQTNNNNNNKNNTGSGTYYNPAQYQDYSTQLASNPVASYLANPGNYPSGYDPFQQYWQNGKQYLSFNTDLLKSCGIILPAKYITGETVDAAIFIKKYYVVLIQKIKQSNLPQKQKRKRIHNLRAQKRELLTQIFHPFHN